MHKIKKGIKKKIKGKKDKEEELFTEEEYERYKKQKEEEAKLHESATDSETVVTSTPEVDHTTNSSNSSPPDVEENGTETKNDWRNFLSTTDTVLKKSSENLEQIKDTSYFQVKKPEKEEVEEVPAPSVTPVPVAAPHKNWVDLHKGLDEEEETAEEPAEVESQKKPIELRVRELKEIAPIEALPSVDVEDYADIFDTTYVDQVESGEVQLYTIPDSPSEDEFNDLDLFDTSIVDKVLAPKEPKKKKSKKGTKKEVKKVVKKEPVKEEPPKKKPVLVNLGSAVQALTKGEPLAPEEKSNKAEPEKEKSPPKDEVNLLFSDTEAVPPPPSESEPAVAEPGAVDNLLFSDEPTVDLPEVVCPIQASALDLGEKKEETNQENSVINVDEFLDLPDQIVVESSNSSNLQILVNEFEPGTKQEVDVVQPTEYKAVDDDIKDEVDAEFAILAAESIAKEKDKSICELGVVDGDDPFDTSSVSQVLGEPEVQSINELKTDRVKSPIDLLASENVESDPFDTSAAKEVLPIDPFETGETVAELPEGLKPEAPRNDSSDGIDPFDTSAAASFGKTELRVLEGELLNNLGQSSNNDDFDFDPRADETATKEASQKSCLLSSELENLDAPVLAPQSNETIEEADPFDTSFAEKVHLKSLEAELLSSSSPGERSNQESSQKHPKPPRPPSPSRHSQIPPKGNQAELDPFDTSIAEGFTESLAPKENQSKHLGLDLKPPRPPSPACLLATTPLDENPTLLPTSKTPEVNETELKNEYDPFDTSIAEQFGKTELRVLETELLVNQKQKVVISPCDDFDPRAEETVSETNVARVPSPDTLLASADTDEQTLPPLSPVKGADSAVNDDIDPFDTSVADKLGHSELSFFEQNIPSAIKAETQEPLNTSAKPPRPIPPKCIFESPLTDESPTIQPVARTTEPDINADIDPFDTSIADKFGNTELKAIEESVLNKSILERVTPRIEEANASIRKSVDDILCSSPTESVLPVLQPVAKKVEENQEEEIDPFDTSIAASFGETELKVLERELLTKSPECDDDFNPRQ